MYSDYERNFLSVVDFIFLVICVVRVGSSAYGDQIMLQFIVQRQPRITLDNLKEVIDTELKQWVNCLKT